jgi:hypothetical protein
MQGGSECYIGQSCFGKGMVGKAGELNGGRSGRILGPLEQCPPECPIHQGGEQR